MLTSNAFGDVHYRLQNPTNTVLSLFPPSNGLARRFDPVPVHHIYCQVVTQQKWSSFAHVATVRYNGDQPLLMRIRPSMLREGKSVIGCFPTAFHDTIRPSSETDRLYPYPGRGRIERPCRRNLHLGDSWRSRQSQRPRECQRAEHLRSRG